MKIFESGKFFTGCNYWASHAGTNMWSDWRPDVIEEDFARLAEAKIGVLRIFPLWSDFQPLRIHRGGGGSEREYRLREDPLPFTEAGRAGVDEVMAERFGVFCDLAEKYGLKLIVGLVTGWMSGRMHMPEAFAGKALLTDPAVIRWQVRFVRYMVKNFKDKPAIAALDLGNECNCMGSADRNAAYLWTTVITDTIKLEDPDKPVVSGLHGLKPDGNWTPEDQGEILDILCTHPYPLFTPHCDTDPLNQMKSILHSTAESVMYETIGGKPCFIEEAGTLGPMIGDEDIAADYIRTALISAWAHDLRGFVWWCANEQSALTHTPYDWDAVERELGLFRLDGSPKPVAGAFADFMKQLGIWETNLEKLPPRITDGVCVLTAGQDNWAAAYGTFLLAKQAGLDITFAWCHDEIPTAPAYFLPALSGLAAIEGHELTELLRRVHDDGASLYLSVNDALLSPFASFAGVKVKTRCRRTAGDTVKLGDTAFSMWSPIRMQMEATTAKTLAEDEENRPVFTVNEYGKGKVYFCAYPLELDASCKPGVISGQTAVPTWRFYEAMGLKNPAKLFVPTAGDTQYIGITEHPVDENRRVLVFVNYTPEERSVTVNLVGWQVRYLQYFTEGNVIKGTDELTITLPGNTGAAVILKK